MTGQNGRGRVSPEISRQLGRGWLVVASLAARAEVEAPQAAPIRHAGLPQYLFWTFAIYAATTARAFSNVDTELVILQVAHLRSCEYGLQHHRQMARRRELDMPPESCTIFRLTTFPNGDGPRKVLSARQRGAATGCRWVIKDRTITAGTWAALAPRSRLLIGILFIN